MANFWDEDIVPTEVLDQQPPIAPATDVPVVADVPDVPAQGTAANFWDTPAESAGGEANFWDTPVDSKATTANPWDAPGPLSLSGMQQPTEQPDIEQPEKFDIKKALKAVPGEASEILKGVGSLALMPFKAIIEAKPKPKDVSYKDFWVGKAKDVAIKTVESVDAALEDMVSTFGFHFIGEKPKFGERGKQEFVFDSSVAAKKWNERPISALLDVLSLGQISGLTKAGKGLAKLGYKKAIKPTKLGGFIKERADRIAVGKATKELRKQAETEHFLERSTQLSKMEDRLRPLSRGERELFADLVQQTGGEEVLKKMASLPIDKQNRLRKTIRWWGKLAAKEQSELIKAGKLTSEQAEMVKWIPKAAEKFDRPIRIVDMDELLPKSLPIDSPSAVFSKGQFKKIIGDLKKEVDADPIYFPGGIRAEITLKDILKGKRGALKTGDYFVDPNKTYRPGFLKKRTGISHLFGAQETDPFKALTRHRAQYLKFRNQKNLIEKIKAQPWTEPLLKQDEINEAMKLYRAGKVSEDAVREIIENRGVKDGYVIFAPDDYMRHYRMNIANDVLQQMDALGTFSDDVMNAIEEILPKKIIASQPEKLFQIPKEAAKALQVHSGVSSFVKIAYDKPTDWWRTSVLQFRPKWQVNNIFGHMVFNSYKGVGPLSYGRAFRDKWKAVVPRELKAQGFIQSESYTAKLGAAGETIAGRAIVAIESSWPAKVLSSVKKFMTNMNEKADDYFRSASAIKSINAKARWEVIKRDGLKLVTTKEKLEYVNNMKKVDPAWIKEIVEDVSQINGNFRNLSAFERKWVRRALPFYSFMKHQVGFISRMPTKHPLRTKLLNDLENTIENLLPENQRKKFKEGKIWIESDNSLWKKLFAEEGSEGKVGRWFDTRYANPVNIPMVSLEPTPHIDPGFLGGINPILQLGFEWTRKKELYSGRSLKSPWVIEEKVPDFKTKYWRILDTEESGVEEVTSPISFKEYAVSKIPPLSFVKKLLGKKEKVPTTSYRVLMNKEIPEEVFNWMLLSTQLPEQEIFDIKQQVEGKVQFLTGLGKAMIENKDVMRAIVDESGKPKEQVMKNLIEILSAF